MPAHQQFQISRLLEWSAADPLTKWRTQAAKPMRLSCIVTFLTLDLSSAGVSLSADKKQRDEFGSFIG
jgi:hypothetical protein